MSPTSLEVGIVFDTEPKSDLALSDPSSFGFITDYCRWRRFLIRRAQHVE